MKPVAADLTARYVDGPGLSVRLVFDPAAPLEVRATFSNRRQCVTWKLSRDVLADALDGPAGMGDAQMWPDGGEIHVRLHGWDGHVETIALRWLDVERFVGRATRMVPRGQERLIGLDRELADLLGGAS